jgi:signal peptidase II
MTRIFKLRMGLLACVACLVGCDHATKLAAEAALRNRAAIPIVRGALDLTYAENRDMAFDAFSRASLHPPAWALSASTVAVTLVVLYLWARRRHTAWPEHAGFALICAGAIGNLVDRVARGYVVDFVRVRFWPVFNLADALVVVGVALLLFSRALARRAPEADGAITTPVRRPG